MSLDSWKDTDNIHSDLVMQKQDNHSLNYDESFRMKYEELQKENVRLKQLLLKHGIDDEQDENIQQGKESLPPFVEDTGIDKETNPITPIFTKQSPLSDRIQLFMSLFSGREDVYARQWRGKDGKIGYSPVCENEWVGGICGKPKVKCGDCPNPAYVPYNESAVSDHLTGKHVLGIYPLLSNDTCRFIAIDFDEANWKSDVRAMAASCKQRGIPFGVEVSRSGNGAHFWLFFSEEIEAALARSFASLLLTQSMQENARLQFSSYDRMFPNQDIMPKGGFGNLIALPFQKEAYQNGGCVFVDRSFTPYPDQWVFLSTLEKINRAQIQTWISKAHLPPLGELRQEDSDEKPWVRSRSAVENDVQLPPTVQCTLANKLYISVDGLSQKALNQMQRLAAFRNPAFYMAQAMRMPVWNKPRIICCAEYVDQYLCLPRGCIETLHILIEKNKSVLKLDDQRYTGRSIAASFRGQLRDEQQPALKALLDADDGVLSATTAFGKTVLAAALIGSRQINTLILVHRIQLMQQWKERLTQFLDIHEELPDAPKKRGRKKAREVIGMYGGGKDTRGGIIDIAIMQSMCIGEEIKPWIQKYGMIIVDECHHVPAISFERVLKEVHAKYVYGLTATPKRQDGHHPILNMYLGPIRYQVDAKAQAAKQPFAHIMIPRFTGARFNIDNQQKTSPIGQYYQQMQMDDLRNHLIVDDVLSCVQEGRHCLLLSERVQHIKILAELIEKSHHHVITLTGGKTGKEASSQIEALRNVPQDQPLIVCATGKYIGEGFDESRLDTLFLTMPISWHGTLAQYAGRLHRLHEGKKKVQVYDYVDNNEETLERMYHKRLKGYATIGYHVSPDASDAAISGDIIYNQNTFVQRFAEDIAQARSSIVIVSPYATPQRVRWFGSFLTNTKEHNVQLTVFLRPADSFQGKNKESAQKAIKVLTEMGVTVHQRKGIHQKYAIIDSRLIWYGSINLLSFGASQESIMRLVSGSVAKALMTE